jgi:hypothetical protein
MKSKIFSPYILIGFGIIVVAVISWYAFPVWQTRPNGALELFAVVILGVLTVAKDLVEVILGVKEIQKKKGKANAHAKSKNMTKVEAKGERSVAVGGDANNTFIQTGDVKEKEKESVDS